MADNDTQENGSSPDGAPAPAKEATQTVTSEMKKVAREAAIVVLTPVVKKVATSMTKQLATKGPELYQQYLEPKIEEAGGIGNLAKQATGENGLKSMGIGKAAESMMDKVTGGKVGGGGRPDGTGRGRRLPIQEAIDVGVPIDVAYNEWTQFENFPEFMHRVEEIEQIDDTHLVWHENIWGRRRTWKAEITDQTPNERIAWRSEEGTENVGVVTFHDLGDRLTRILVNLDFQPQGVMEKTASGLRMSRRALRSDLMRFKAHIEMQDEEEGAWRGTIDDGEVVDYDDDYDPEGARAARRDDDEADDQSDEADEADEEYDEEPEEQSDEDVADDDAEDEYDDEEYDDEPEDQSDEDEEYDDEDEPEPEPAVSRRRSRSSSSTRSSRPAKKASSRPRRAASKATSQTGSTARKSASAARRTSRPARRASGTAKKSSSTARKASSTAKKTARAPRSTSSRTAKKASSSARTAKKTSGSATRKASGTAKKSASTARRSTSRTAKKSTGPARKRAAKKASSTRKSASTARKSTSSRSGSRRSSR